MGECTLQNRITKLPIRAANQAEHWREARSWLQRGLDFWTDGTLAGSDGPGHARAGSVHHWRPRLKTRAGHEF
jgi:hypothetical protein